VNGSRSAALKLGTQIFEMCAAAGFRVKLPLVVLPALTAAAITEGAQDLLSRSDGVFSSSRLKLWLGGSSTGCAEAL
jgi:hypothetical protein